MDRALLITSIAAAVIYLVTIPWQPFPGSAALKGLAISPLALLAARLLAGRDRVLLASALAFSALGDVLLALGDRFFLHGLLAFLVAHLIYINLFRNNWSKPVTMSVPALVALLGLLFWSIFVTVLIIPKLEMMGPAVAFYIGAVTGMAACALLVNRPTRLIAAGAVLFVISDSILGLNRFRSPIPLGSYWIWSTYVAAQFAISFGFFRTSPVLPMSAGSAAGSRSEPASSTQSVG